jgi:hypothetical protein
VKAEGSSATSNVRDVTEVRKKSSVKFGNGFARADVTDVRKRSEVRGKKSEGFNL